MQAYMDAGMVVPFVKQYIDALHRDLDAATQKVQTLQTQLLSIVEKRDDLQSVKELQETLKQKEAERLMYKQINTALASNLKQAKEELRLARLGGLQEIYNGLALVGEKRPRCDA